MADEDQNTQDTPQNPPSDSSASPTQDDSQNSKEEAIIPTAESTPKVETQVLGETKPA